MYTGVLLLFVTIPHITTSAKLKDNSRIHYPGPIKESSLNSRYGGNSNVPDECKHQTYCTIKPKDYPQERFNSLFQNVRPIPQASLSLTDLDDRQGDPEEIDNCESIVTYEALYQVRSDPGDWKTVLQAPEKNYVQKVRLETCQGIKEPCFTIFPEQPSYTAACKQKFSSWEFVVEGSEPGKWETVKVDLPTCCSCHYKPT